MRHPSPSVALFLLACVAPSCMGRDMAPSNQRSDDKEAKDLPDRFVMLATEPPAEEAAPAAPGAMRSRAPTTSSAAMKVKESLGGEGAGAKKAEPEEQAAEAALRAWFPETFLWEPLVVTDSGGRASAELVVPDSLTTWRVLALAHGKGGEQAGTVGRFSSTLPVYTDVVLPPALRVGDRLKIPVQVVNNQGNAANSSLSVTVEGGASGSSGGSVAVSPWGSAVRYVEVQALQPGQALVSLRLGSTDRVERSVPIQPAGRRITTARGGTLGAARELRLAPEETLRPTASSVSLTVYPGPLSFVMAELAQASARIQDLPSAAYAFALVGQGGALASRWGVEPGAQGFPKAQELRALRLRAWQGLVKGTRAGNPLESLLAIEALRSLPEDPLAKDLADRLAAQLAAAQSPDGSFAALWSGSGTSLERALVFSAEAARLAGDRQKPITQRSRGFIARNGASIRSPYTAAVVLASGLADEHLQARLHELLLASIVSRPEGDRWLEADALALRADGSPPSLTEATARALLALADQEDSRTLQNELGSSLLSSYSPSTGFGDPRTGLVALSALGGFLRDPMPESVEVILSGDGRELLRQKLDLAGGFTPALLQIPPSTKVLPEQWRIEASPPVPGLAWSLTRDDWVRSPPRGATEERLRVSHRGKGKVGERMALALLVPTSRSRSFQIEIELPTGLNADEDALRSLQSQGRILSFQARAGHIGLQTPTSSDETAWSLELPLIPSMAGRLEGGEITLDLGRAERFHTAMAPVEIAL